MLTPHTPLGWFFGFMVAGSIGVMLFTAVTWLFLKGVGIWGLNIPVGWGFAIINFVWWIGIGHAGTLISAILLLFKQQWRNSINRFAEAMTIFAVVCAGMFPLIHVGRPWLGYWLLPYPNTHERVAAVPFPAVMGRLRGFHLCHHLRGLLVHQAWFPTWGRCATTPRPSWRNTSTAFSPSAGGARCRHWMRYETASLLLAGLATPLVLSVHSVISFDFAVAVLPGWHTTIFPPYFVAGAIYSGFAMVITLAIPIRKFYHLEGLITIRHIDNMGKVMLATGLIVAYGYAMEVFMAWYSASHWEYFMMWNRMFGPMGWAYWVLITCNIALPQLLWLRSVRVSPGKMFIMSLIINTGMWFERFVIIVTSLYRDFLPSSWGTYKATRWDYATFVGTLGLFTALFFLFIRFSAHDPHVGDTDDAASSQGEAGAGTAGGG